ncbi:MAG: NAD(P)-dependent oxidoreductase [Gammaproteobacteria bacterium]
MSSPKVGPKVGVLGLGAMGAPMARNLARHGLLAQVWNRSADKALALSAELGCPAATSPAELARDCEILLSCVSADADLLEVVAALKPGLRRGGLLIDCSTVARDTAERVARELAECGAEFLDAPVSGGVEGARKGSLTIMCGGSAEAFARAQPVLQAIGQRALHMGPAGSGQATKAVNQVLAAGINQAVCEALAFASALKLPLDEVIDAIGSGAAGNWFINHRGKTMTRGVFTPGFKLALHHKDLDICARMAEQAGLPLPLSLQTRDEYAKLMQQGHGDEDISALYRLRRPQSSGRSE